MKPFVLLNATLLIHRLGGPPSPLEKAKESDKSKFGMWIFILLFVDKEKFV